MKKLACLIIVAMPAVGLAQRAPSVPGQYAPSATSNRLGYSSASDFGRSAPSSAPPALQGYTPPKSTPGSTTGYVNGAYVPGASFSGGAPSGGTNTTYNPNYNAMGSAGSDGGSNPYVQSSSIYSKAGTGADALPPPTFSGNSALMGAAPSSSLFGSSGLVGPIPGSQTAAPSTQPGVVAAPTDEAYTTALKRFNEGHYQETLSLLNSPAHADGAPLPTRKLYVASLVADGQLSMAAFEALKAAKDNPLTFFTETTLAATYKQNPDLPQHIKAVQDFTRGTSGTLDPGILVALYNQLSPAGTDPYDTLAQMAIKCPDEDKPWFEKLKSTVKPRVK